MKTPLLFCVAAVAVFAAGTPCEKLAEMTIPDVTVRSAAVAQSVG